MKSLLINAIAVIAIYLGIINGMNDTMLLIGVGLVTILLIANAASQIFSAIFWNITAIRKDSSVVNDGNELYERKKEAVLEATNDLEVAEQVAADARMEYWGAVAKMGLATFKAIAQHHSRATYYSHIALSIALFATIYFLWEHPFAKTIGVIVMIAEIVSYNCLGWLAKHKEAIRDEIEGLHKTLLSMNNG